MVGKKGEMTVLSLRDEAPMTPLGRYTSPPLFPSFSLSRTIDLFFFVFLILVIILSSQELFSRQR